MRTVHTSPNGTADVVAVGGFFRVRVRHADGTWTMTGRKFTATYLTRRYADEVDRFRPDGSGRFGQYVRDVVEVGHEAAYCWYNDAVRKAQR